MHLDAHGCREQERRAGPDECLGREEAVREENNSIHSKRGSLSTAEEEKHGQVRPRKAESLVRGI